MQKNRKNSIISKRKKTRNKRSERKTYMYQLIAIDLDGTLLNAYGEVSEENKKAITYAQEKGAIVMLTSGRPIQSVQHLARELGTNQYCICGNGATVHDLQKQEMLYQNAIEKKRILELIEICERNSIYYSIYTEEGILAKSLNFNVLYYNQENKKKTEDKRTPIIIEQNLYDYIQQDTKHLYLKFSIADENPVIFTRMREKLKQMKHLQVLDIEHQSRKVFKSGTEYVTIAYYYTEITNENVHKWSAIEQVMKEMGITANEVMAIGDNVNDETMLRNAGLGVAMGNSPQNIQQIANVITDTHIEDGVAKAIYKYIK